MGVLPASPTETELVTTSGRKQPPSMALPHKGEGKPSASHQPKAIIAKDTEKCESNSAQREPGTGVLKASLKHTGSGFGCAAPE